MQAHHWIALLLLLAVGYFIGARWPILAQKVGAA